MIVFGPLTTDQQTSNLGKVFDPSVHPEYLGGTPQGTTPGTQGTGGRYDAYTRGPFSSQP